MDNAFQTPPCNAAPADTTVDNTLYARPAEWLEGQGSMTGNMLLTGRAGSGKTTLLRRFVTNTARRTLVLAPTGIAAINAGGQTLHSFFKLPPRLIEPGDVKRLRSARLTREIDTIVIDEISMVRADLLDGVDRSLKLNREDDRPFGGVRLILSGDLHQLAPIARGDEQTILTRRHGGPYFFNTSAFQDGNFTLLALKHIFRQDDPRFLALLAALRRGHLTGSDQTTLANLVSRQNAITASGTHIVLTPNNANADRINKARLDDLPGRERVFEATIQGTLESSAWPNAASLTLKPGARVMLIKNDSDGRWVNGTLATITGFSRNGVTIDLNGNTHDVGPALWEKYQYTLDTDSGKVSRKTVATFRQIPVRLAYAMTIHKAQGLTLDRVYIDFDNGMFAHGQAYVAFSRARQLSGLALSRLPRTRDLVIDPAAVALGKYTILQDTPAWRLIQVAPHGERVP